jgi:hypothetical protein
MKICNSVKKTMLASALALVLASASVAGAFAQENVLPS